MRAVWVWLLVPIFSWLVLGATPAWAVPALVRGTSALKVRRGPGPQYPAFARLQREDRVEVKKIEGDWASIRTASGAVGWVHRDYLRFPAGLPSREAAAAPPAPPPETAPETAAGAMTGEPSEPDAQPQLAAVAESLAKPGAEPQTAPADGAQPPFAADIQNELQRLVRLTEEVHARVEAMRTSPSPAGSSDDADDARHLATTAWLLVIGVLFGAFVGSAYGRQRERRRRTRVRF